MGAVRRFSYSIYIYHFLILQTFYALGLLAPASSPLPLAAEIAAVLLVACLSWNSVESRFLKMRIENRRGGAEGIGDTVRRQNC